MRNIPVFTTENGVASLGISTVPEDGKAYITVQDSCDVTVFLEECAQFCRAVGARSIYATGKNVCLPEIYATVLSMSVMRHSIEDTDACLMPVRREDEARWLQIYHEKMAKVPGAGYLKQVPRDAYFIHCGGELLGIGAASGDTVSVVASVAKGSGKQLVQALAHAVTGDILRLEVAAENKKAVALYEGLGFLATGVREIWYKI